MTTFEAKETARRQRIVERADRAKEKVLAQMKTPTLTPTQYKAALKRLDLTIVGAAPFFGISRRQAQRIAAEGPIPKLVARVIKLLLDGTLKKEDLS